MLLLILLFFFPEWWLLGLFVVANLAFGMMQGGIEGGVLSAAIAAIIGLPIVLIRRWFKNRGATKQEAEVDAELARIRAANPSITDRPNH